MNEDKPRKLVYVEKKTGLSNIYDTDVVWYECPECGKRYDWLNRNRGGGGNKFCVRCGNYLSWAKLDLENYKESASDFDKNMPLWKFLEDPRYGHLWENEVSMTYSQSEVQILEGCIALLGEMAGYFQRYLEWIGFEPNEEEKNAAYFGMSYFHIVNRLFLWHTNHSGGTSTRKKCKCLGIEDASENVQFRFWEEKEEEEDE